MFLSECRMDLEAWYYSHSYQCERYQSITWCKTPLHFLYFWCTDFYLVNMSIVSKTSSVYYAYDKLFNNLEKTKISE